MHSWKDTTWKMFKKQNKSCTGSLGTGSDTDRTRFLVNVISQISKILRRNRVPYWYNPVPGTKTRDMFFWENLEPGSLLGRNRFLKGYFQKYFLKNISNKVFLDVKIMGYVYVDECIFLWTCIFKIKNYLYHLTFDDSSIILQ